MALGDWIDRDRDDIFSRRPHPYNVNAYRHTMLSPEFSSTQEDLKQQLIRELERQEIKLRRIEEDRYRYVMGFGGDRDTIERADSTFSYEREKTIDLIEHIRNTLYKSMQIPNSYFIPSPEAIVPVYVVITKELLCIGAVITKLV